MADFWIKIEKGTPDKPEILELAAILNIEDPDTITGKMIRVWSWFDSNSENGHAPTVTKVLLDRLTGVTGFTESLVTVGWLEKTDDGFLIPNFDRHLGKGAKKRASDAERKRKSRDSHSKCHSKSVTKTGLEKSREEKIIKDQKILRENIALDELIDRGFEIFYGAGLVKKSRKTAYDKFKLLTRKLNADPVELGELLASDIRHRIAICQFGIDKLHPATYLNQQRWEDEKSDNEFNSRGGRLSAAERIAARNRELFGDDWKLHLGEDGRDLRGAVGEGERGGTIIDVEISPEQIGYEPD